MAKELLLGIFYAVILKSRPAIVDQNVDDERCSRGYYPEDERLRIQRLFPGNKVFASRNGCYLAPIWYTNVNGKFEFVAVYAGETEAAARSLLKKVKQISEFSDANIRRMKVVFGNGD